MSATYKSTIPQKTHMQNSNTFFKNYENKRNCDLKERSECTWGNIGRKLLGGASVERVLKGDLQGYEKAPVAYKKPRLCC